MVRREDNNNNNIVSYFGVQIPISHFTLHMDYYPPMLNYIIVSKDVALEPEPSISRDERLAFIGRLLQRLNRRFIFINDFVVDFTAEQNMFATKLEIDLSKDKIISSTFIEKKRYNCIFYEHVCNLIDVGNCCYYMDYTVDRICKNMKKLQNLK